MKARLPRNMAGGAQNMNGMIKQAQKMQEQITQIQEDIENRDFEATAGGEAVKVVMNGRKEVKDIIIKPEVVNPDDVEMLQDLIISALNECVANISEVSEKEIGAVTGGVSFPGLF